MPYVKNVDRRRLLSGLSKPLTPVELNFRRAVASCEDLKLKENGDVY